MNSRKDATEDEVSIEDGGYKNFMIESSTKKKSDNNTVLSI